jgi:Bacterial Ig-like domain (group 3)
MATLSGVVLNGLGTHTITASYAGVANTFFLSTGTGTIVVSQASVTVAGPAHAVSLSSGQAGSVAIAVKGAFSALSAPSGAVSYSILNSSNTSVLSGTAVLASGNGSSAATISIPGTLAPGSYTISVNYIGDTNYQSAASTVSLSVGKLASALSLGSSANPSIVTSAVTLIATTTSSSSTPTGTVSFFDGTALLGTATLSQGQASYATANFAAGAHSITVAYVGDNNFTASTSSDVVQLVQDFTLSTSTSGTTNASSATVTPGGTAIYTLSFGPSVGTVFPAPITLSVSGLPPGATATLSPQTLPAGSSLSSVTLTIQLPQQTSELRRDLRLAAPALALLFLPFAGRLRRTGKTLQRLSFVLLLLIAGAGAMTGLTGCGAKDSGFFGQAETTYNVLITATSGSLSHSTSVTLIVQ